MNPPASLSDIDWSTWQAKDTATLAFVIKEGQILLIRKKRGLGAGKINGPGGRLEANETIVACAIREAQEELGITPINPVKRGELKFQFADGYSIHVHVFRAEDLEGTPIETDEAIPIWAGLDAVPYDEMWEDDEIWIPHLIAGRTFAGRFIFDDDKMLDHVLDAFENDAPMP
ncbi:MAG: 8-oxo-dGTP diphosphatase [Bacteroidota bacterium]